MDLSVGWVCFMSSDYVDVRRTMSISDVRNYVDVATYILFLLYVRRNTKFDFVGRWEYICNCPLRRTLCNKGGRKHRKCVAGILDLSYLELKLCSKLCCWIAKVLFMVPFDTIESIIYLLAQWAKKPHFPANAPASEIVPVRAIAQAVENACTTVPQGILAQNGLNIALNTPHGLNMAAQQLSSEFHLTPAQKIPPTFFGIFGHPCCIMSFSKDN
jgi:hypothetical protein